MTKRYQKALLSISYIDRKQQKKKKTNYLSLQGCSNMILDFFFIEDNPTNDLKACFEQKQEHESVLAFVTTPPDHPYARSGI